MRGSRYHREHLSGDKTHQLSLTLTVMTMECRIVTVVLSLLKPVDVEIKCITLGDETEENVMVMNNRRFRLCAADAVL